MSDWLRRLALTLGFISLFASQSLGSLLDLTTSLHETFRAVSNTDGPMWIYSVTVPSQNGVAGSADYDASHSCFINTSAILTSSLFDPDGISAEWEVMSGVEAYIDSHGGGGEAEVTVDGTLSFRSDGPGIAALVNQNPILVTDPGGETSWSLSFDGVTVGSDLITFGAGTHVAAFHARSYMLSSGPSGFMAANNVGHFYLDVASPQAVPEPASLAVLSVALVGFVRRRRQ